MSVRGAFIRLHRWAGLTLAAFLVVAGVTGSIIAFNHELDEWLNPELFRVADRGETIPALELAERLERAQPHLLVRYVPLDVEPGHAAILGVTARPGVDAADGDAPIYREVFINPVTGTTLGEREWGACCLERKHLLPFLYKLHYSLHLPDLWGWWLMGAVAIVWMLDCFVGFYITLPSGRGKFWQRWKPSWQIRKGAGAYNLNFDVHRAFGLWLWALLLMIAVSGAYLALQFEVFRPGLSTVASITPSRFDPKAMQAPVVPGVPFSTVVAAAARDAAERGVVPPFDVFYSPEFALFGVGLGDHHAPGIGVTYLYYDGRTGEARGDFVPGRGTAADVAMQWMFPLHSGQVIGLPGRILISLSGLAVAVLSITGVVIWARKRRAAVRRRAEAPQFPEPALEPLPSQSQG